MHTDCKKISPEGEMDHERDSREDLEETKSKSDHLETEEGHEGDALVEVLGEQQEETQAQEEWFEKLDFLLDSLNTEWLLNSDSDSPSSEESASMQHTLEMDSICI